MQKPTQPVREGFHTVTPYLVVQGAARLLTFLEQAFDAKILFRMDGPDGAVGHTEVQIGDSMVMLSECATEWPALQASLYLYVDDADAVYHKALAAGARSIREPADMPYGERQGGVVDPSGNQWWMGTPIPEAAPENA